MEESEASHESGSLHEHRTTRANNIYLIDEDHEYGHTLRKSGSVIQALREESRRIWMVDGRPGIFFDLDQSETFKNMCLQKYEFNVDDYLFTPGELSLKNNDDLVQTTKEQVIEESILEFQEYVMEKVNKSDSYRSISWSAGAHLLPESKQYLESLDELVHKDEFIIQQNRDLYREICQHVCAEMLDSEHATYIRTKLFQDLNKALDADDFGMTYGINEKILADVMTQLISNLRAHERLQIVRKYNKEYRKFARVEVQKAREEMRLGMKNVWRANPGDDETIVQKRKKMHKELETVYHAQTNWEYLKKEFDLGRSQGYDTSEKIQRIRSEKQKHIKEYIEKEKENEFEEQNRVKEIAERYEENARKIMEKAKLDKRQENERTKMAFDKAVALREKSSRITNNYKKKYENFRKEIRTQFQELKIERRIRQNLNIYEDECIKKISQFSVLDVGEIQMNNIVEQSVQNMHENINVIMLAEKSMGGEDNQGIIESQSDNIVYDRMTELQFQDLTQSQRSNRQKNKDVILIALQEMITNSMNKRDTARTEASSLIASNYNPYLI